MPHQRTDVRESNVMRSQMPACPRLVVCLCAAIAACVLALTAVHAGAAGSGYTLLEKWGALPAGQEWGEVTGVAVNARNTIVAVRRSDPPIIEMDPSGKVLKMWGEKMFV